MHMILARGVDILSLVKKEEMEYILSSDMGTYWSSVPSIFCSVCSRFTNYEWIRWTYLANTAWLPWNSVDCVLYIDSNVYKV